jgi:hypothetical protein
MEQEKPLSTRTIISKEPGLFHEFSKWIIKNYKSYTGIDAGFDESEMKAFTEAMLLVGEQNADWYRWSTFQKVVKDGMLGKYGPVYNLSARQVNTWLMEHRRRENSKI